MIASRILLGLLLAAGGLAVPAAGASAPRKVGLLPIETVNISAFEGKRYQQLMVKTLGRRSAMQMVQQSAVSRLLGSMPNECSARIDCLRRVGRRLAAHKLLMLRVGVLGETVVVRLTVFDVARGVRQGTWQEVLRQPSDAAIGQAMDRMVDSFAPLPPSPRPWYSRWWVWTAAGVVVAGTVTAVVLSTRARGPEPDLTIRPP